MNCPNCGTPEKARVRVCGNCGTTYASEDLLEYRQLEFLLSETSSWLESVGRRAPYVKKFEELKARILPAKPEPLTVSVAPPQPKPQPAPVTPATVISQQPKPVIAVQAPAPPAAPVATPVPPQPQKPKAEAIPFDQWLLSERNIKFALYSGGLLFVLAGLIFIGLNWDKLNGALKLVVTLFVTGFLYASGLFLMSRKFLKFGGVALLTIASSFVPINFAVLQIYIARDLGVTNETMWLIASLFAVAVYAVTTIYTRTQSLAYLSLLAMASGVSAILRIANAPFANYLLAYSILALGFLAAAHLARRNSVTEFVRFPLLIVSQIAAPILLVVSASAWLVMRLSADNPLGNPWAALAALLVGTVFYAATDWLYGWRIARWVVGAAFAATVLFALFELKLSLNWIGFAMSVLALGYMLAAYALEQKKSREDALPLLVESHLGAPALFGINALVWLYSFSCATCGADNPWISIAAMFIGVLFYGATDALYRQAAARAAWGIAFGVAFFFALVQFHLPSNSIAFGMTLLALIYLGAAYAFEKYSSPRAAFSLLIEAQIATPVLFVANAVLWMGGSALTWLSLGAMFLVVAFYVATDLLFHVRAARWASGATFATTFLFTLNQLHLVANAIGLVMTVLAVGYLALAYLIEKRSSRSEGLPFFGEAQLMALPLFLANAFLWIRSTGCGACPDGSPWLSLGAMFLVVVFFVATDALYQQRAARWASAIFFAAAIVFALTELKLTPIQTGIILKVLALAYLVLGYVLERREAKRAAGMPLYATAYVVAGFVTFQSLLKLPNGQFDLALALIADALLLAVSAKKHRNYSWMYGAVWLFMAPMFLFLQLYVPGLVGQGVGLGALMVIYVAAGYGVGQRTKYYSGPFLTAAAFLSVVVVALTWANGLVAVGTLVVIALAYAFVAVWLGWQWLLLATLTATNLAVAALTRSYSLTDDSSVRALTLCCGALGVAFAFSGYALRRAGLSRWAMPLYLVAVLNSGGAYIESLALQKEFAVGASAVFAALALVFAWLEREEFEKSLTNLPTVLSYVGTAMILIGTFFALDWARLTNLWQPFIAGICALLILLEWFVHGEAVGKIYVVPARQVGLVALLTASVGALLDTNFVASALTLGIAGVALIGDGVYRKMNYWVYGGVGMFVLAIWFLLRNWNVTQLQAYVMPFAFWLLAIGWNEKRRGHRQEYLILSMAGLLVLMGSALWQSLGSVWYSALLGVESIAALYWGIRTKTRGYVQLSILSLLGNGIVLFWFGFANLDKWLQLSVVGLLLLAIGLVALFRREQVLSAMQELNRWEA